MSFHSVVFLVFFFPACVIGNRAVRPQRRDGFLLLMSMAFYAWSGVEFAVILLCSSAFAYLFGLAAGRLERAGRMTVRAALFVCAVAVHLCVLFRYKYLADVLRLVCGGTGAFPDFRRVLPLGISFYTFSVLSYETDVFLKSCPPQKNALRLFLYTAFFPKVVQGPVMQYSDFERQRSGGTVPLAQAADGMELFVIGLSKKVFIADRLQGIVDYSFGAIADVGSVPAWLGIVGYAIQLYYDFSGYSDMALGLGKMLGFTLPPNFDYPFLSRSVTEFWQRWHMSLGQWFRTYLYIPLMKLLVGSPPLRRLKNPAAVADICSLFVVWVVIGVWHGSGARFLLYGLWWFAFIAFERLLAARRRRMRKLRGRGAGDTALKKAFGHAVTLAAVVLGLVILRKSGVDSFYYYWKRMIKPDARDGLLFLAELGNSVVFAFVAGIVFSFPVLPALKRKIAALGGAAVALYRVFLFALFVCAFSFVAGSGYSPFLYQVF